MSAGGDSKKCCEPGCESSIYAKNRCRKHYCRYFADSKKTKCIKCEKPISHRTKRGLCSLCSNKDPEIRKKIGISSANRNYSENKKKEIAQKTSASLKKRFEDAKEERIEKYKEIVRQNNEVDIFIDWTTFKGRNEKIRTVDPIYGEWWTDLCSLMDGVTHPKRYKEKVKKTCLERYGVDNPSKLEENKEKARQTCLEKYGVEHFTKTQEYKESYKQTCLEKYGSEHFFSSEECKDKLRDISIEKFGVDHPFKSEEVKEKIKASCIERYGVEWTGAIPEAIKKRKQTNKELYGVENTSQNLEIALKIARKTNQPYIKSHWQTNEELVCQGSYEAKVVDYLNTNQINYKWQPEIFKLSTGKTYRPDLYLVDTDTWVEIKGYFRDDGKKKWEEFITIVNRSELWDKNKLKEMGIL